MKQHTTGQQEQEQTGRIVILDPAPAGSVEAIAAILLQIAKRTLDEDAQAVLQCRQQEAA